MKKPFSFSITFVLVSFVFLMGACSDDRDPSNPTNQQAACRMSSIADGYFTQRYFYDDQDRVDSIVVTTNAGTSFRSPVYIAYDGEGRITKIVSDFGTATYQYEGGSTRPSLEVVDAITESFDPDTERKFTYDAASNLIRMDQIYHWSEDILDSTYVLYDYDNDGNRIRETDYSPDEKEEVVVQEMLTYDADKKPLVIPFALRILLGTPAGDGVLCTLNMDVRKHNVTYYKTLDHNTNEFVDHRPAYTYNDAGYVTGISSVQITYDCK